MKINGVGSRSAQINADPQPCPGFHYQSKTKRTETFQIVMKELTAPVPS